MDKLSRTMETCIINIKAEEREAMVTLYALKNSRPQGKAQKSNSMVPMINIIPAVIYSIAFRQHFLPDITGWQKAGLYVAFVLIYMILSFLPYISLLMNVASTVMFVGMIWALVDHIGTDVVRIIVKVITAGFVGMLEFAVFVDRTIGMKKQMY